MAIDIGKIRNVGFVGHGGVGKTSLVEAMLFAAGAVNRLGKVDDGTTTTDFDPDEIKRKISINTAVAFCDYKGHRHQPGRHPRIRRLRRRRPRRAARGRRGGGGGGRRGRRAGADREGLEVRQRVRPAARRSSSTASTASAPTSSARSSRCSKRLKGRLVPFQVPIGAESGFRGVVDLITDEGPRSPPTARPGRPTSRPTRSSACRT